MAHHERLSRRDAEPAHLFIDRDLQLDNRSPTGLGCRPITGGFASVYQVVSGGTKWAVRCFLATTKTVKRVTLP